MATGQFGGTGDGSRNLNNPNNLGKPAAITQPFTGQTSQNLTGGYGYTYTNDVLNSLQPEGVANSQYQNFSNPATAPITPPQTGGGGGGGGGTIFPGKGSGATVGDQQSYAYPGMSNSQVFGLSGMGGAPKNSGATFNGLSPGLQMARSNYLGSAQGQALLQSLGIKADNRYAPRDKDGNVLGPDGKPLTQSSQQISHNNLQSKGPSYQQQLQMQHPAVQAAAQLGVPAWQTQQAMALGYHPLLHPAAQQAMVQHPQTGQLYPQALQHLSQGGSLTDLFHGGGG